jgi:hypothetical protein
MRVKGGVTSNDVPWKSQVITGIRLDVLLTRIKGMGNFKTPQEF